MSLEELKSIKDAFIQEMVAAHSGQPSSLPFIQHTLGSSSLVADNEVFQTLVIGGSYYQKAVMQKVEGNIKILEHTQGEQPPFLTEEQLMEFILEHIDPKVQTVALNFAYPLNPMTRGDIVDGVLQGGSKENTFVGLVGKPVGESVEQYIKAKQNRDIKVAVANDTICLLLSGLIHNTWEHLAAGIVGTGLNFAVFLDEHTVVNLESGNFDKFTQTEAGKEIDLHSAAPGDAKFEKEISGAYLFKHFNYLAQKRNLHMDAIGSSKQLDYIISAPTPALSALAQEILTTSASLVATQIAGIMEFCKRDIVFIMQGSLYWKGNKYKETIEKLVIELTPQYKASYENILHSDLYGAAKLVA